MLVAAVLVGTLVRWLAPTTVICISLFGIGLCVAFIAAVTAVWQIIVVLLLVGLMITPMQAMVSTLAQTTVPDDQRGRVGSVMSAVISATSVTSMAVTEPEHPTQARTGLAGWDFQIPTC